ncbi:MAG: hypothetical protein FWC91_07235 [Defluviitaleaceae bacterium]|nr:hypothetical protein [Defluviitaleaceae bacterium]
MSDFKLPAEEKVKIGGKMVLFLPKITPITNIEYETRRKFYYNSDNFINGFTNISRNIPNPLTRIFKVLDNRDIFLKYPTSNTLSFHYGKDADGNIKYLPWWERLRNTKSGGIKADKKLLREYAFEMDKKCVQKRAINAVASSAVYGDRVDTGFIADMSDFLLHPMIFYHFLCIISLSNTP